MKRFAALLTFVALSAFGQSALAQPQAGVPGLPESQYSTLPGPNAQSNSSHAEHRPSPDPTTLTTQQLNREIASVKEIIETRLAGMDKAIQLLQTATDKFPANIAASVAQLQQLHAEKFMSVDNQFMERDVRTEQTATRDKTAIVDALQAQKEAVSNQNISNSEAIRKSEDGFKDQILQLGVLMQTQSTAANEKIDDLRNRLAIYEGQAKGMDAGYGYLVAAVTAGAAIITVVIFVFRGPPVVVNGTK